MEIYSYGRPYWWARLSIIPLDKHYTSLQCSHAAGAIADGLLSSDSPRLTDRLLKQCSTQRLSGTDWVASVGETVPPFRSDIIPYKHSC